MAEEVVKVALIGTGDGTMPEHGTVVETAEDQSNLVVVIVQPLVAILIRFANAYLITLVGLVTGGMATDIIPAADFAALVVSCAKLSLAGAGLGLLKDLVTIFGKLEQKYPLLTGSI